GFRKRGDVVFLLGESSRNLEGSEYLAYLFQIEGGLPPEPDLEVERKIQDACLQAIRRKFAVSCHDCSDGGLAVALSECCMAGGMGAEITLSDLDPETLFSEAPSRILLTAPPEYAETVIALFQERNVPFSRIGVTAGDSLVLASRGTRISIPVAALEEASRSGLISALEGTADAT
ncbi:MAG: phosphoribosylformylglycinamidine synthase II, partial [Armatimonadetes bacterium]|nr:phosphoribosylformylglycinamidine synthase II [Armatimonadota bacterium]